MIQEFVTGPLAGFTAVCQEGEILEHFMFEVTRAAGLNDALLSRAKSIHSEVCFAHAAALAKKLRWTGAFDLDFCHAGKDRYLLYEINPRFSGTIQFAYNCGVDLPRALFELSQGEVKKRPRARYSEHRMYRSVFPEEFDRVILQRGQWADFLLGFLDPRYSYDFSLRDRRLLLWQLRIAKWKLQDEKGRARTRASRRLTQPPPEK